MDNTNIETAEIYITRAHTHCYKNTANGQYAAFSCFIEAAKIAPKNAQIFLKFGDFFQHFMNDSKRAYACYERALLLQPNSSEIAIAYHCSSIDLLSQETSQKYLQNFIRADLSSDSLPALQRLAIYYMYTGDHSLSKRICDLAIDIDSNNFIFRLLKAELTRLTGMSISSIFKTALQKCEEFPEWRLLVRLLVTISSLKSGDFEEIAGTLEELMNSREESDDLTIFDVLYAEVMCYLGDDLLSANRFYEATDLFLLSFETLRGVLSREGGNQNMAMFLFGYSSFRLSQLCFHPDSPPGNESFQTYAKLSIWAFGHLAVATKLSSAYYNCALAASLLWRDVYDDAVKDLAVGCAVSSILATNGSSDSWLLLGTISYLFKDFFCAEKSLIKSIEASVHNHRSLVNLSLLYYTCKAFDASFEIIERSKNVSFSRDCEILLKILLMNCDTSNSHDLYDRAYNHLLMAINSANPSIHTFRLFADQVVARFCNSYIPEKHGRPYTPSFAITRDSPPEEQILRAVEGLVSYLEARPYDVMAQSLVGSLMEILEYKTAVDHHKIAVQIISEEADIFGWCELSGRHRVIIFNALRCYPMVDERITAGYILNLSLLPGITQIELVNGFLALYNLGEYSMAFNILSQLPNTGPNIRLRALTMFRNGGPMDALDLLVGRKLPELAVDIFYLAFLVKDVNSAHQAFKMYYCDDSPVSAFLSNLWKFMKGDKSPFTSLSDLRFCSFFKIDSKEFIQYFVAILSRQVRTSEFDTIGRLISNCEVPPSFLSRKLYYALQQHYYLSPP